MVEMTGIEPADLLLAKQVLSQLSYIPTNAMGFRLSIATNLNPIAIRGGPSWGRTTDLALIKRAL